MRFAVKHVSLLFLLIGLLSPVAFAKSKFNLTAGVTPISQQIYDLHMIIFYICVAIGVVVFAVLAYSLLMHRKSRGVVPAKFHENTSVEILWAVIPLFILIIMAIPATKVLIEMQDSGKADLTVKITGYQWKWKYDYLDQGISFFSHLATPLEQINNQVPKEKNYLLEVDRELVVPIHKKIRFLITSNDVIHSWWVPDLGVKKDAVPGFIHDSWAWIEKPGTYRGQCAELCGTNHGFMPVVVKAVSQSDFDQWVLNQTAGKRKATAAAKEAAKKIWSKEELLEKGKKAYTTQCAVCHKPNGKGMPPAFPALKAGKITTGPVKKHIDIVLNGVPGTAMQAFGAQLSDLEIAAIVSYERNTWGNNNRKKWKKAGGIVQPATVAALRKTQGE